MPPTGKKGGVTGKGRSDPVLCPVDINSHNACLSVKRLCKKLQVPYRMIHSSSQRGIAQSLDEGPRARATDVFGSTDTKKRRKKGPKVWRGVALKVLKGPFS